MEIFSIDLTLNELNFIRQSLETVTIQGKDAKFLANLQMRLEHELSEAQRLKQEEENKKLLGLTQAIAADSQKNSNKK
jgi:predicted house-cleaning noncanonical NTP pyrophosphatase (MazG superfamily)